MSVFGRIIENNTRKVPTDDATKHRLRNEESNISKSKIENGELGLDEEIVEGKKLL